MMSAGFVLKKSLGMFWRLVYNDIRNGKGRTYQTKAYIIILLKQKTVFG